MFLKLVRLDISLNRIAVLPVELRFMVSLVELCVEHNPLTSPPAHVISRINVSQLLGYNSIAFRLSCAQEDESTFSSTWKWRPSRRTENEESWKEGTAAPAESAAQAVCPGSRRPYLMLDWPPTTRVAKSLQLKATATDLLLQQNFRPASLPMARMVFLAGHKPMAMGIRQL